MATHEPVLNRPTRLALNFKKFAESLAAISRCEEPYSYLDMIPDQATFERQQTIAVLRQVHNFLHSQRIISAILFQLILALEAINFPGSMQPIFRPAHKSGRRPDDKAVQGMKGGFAAIAYTQMLGGMAREQAISWTARNMPPAIAKRIYSKPITTSTIKEWMAQYGCNARIRGELKSATTPNEFEQFLAEKIDSDCWQRSFGRKQFLRILRIGYECHAEKNPFPFREIIDLLMDETMSKILADSDTELGETSPIIPKQSRVISSPSDQPHEE